jgi:hypothetical protein
MLVGCHRVEKLAHDRVDWTGTMPGVGAGVGAAARANRVNHRQRHADRPACRCLPGEQVVDREQIAPRGVRQSAERRRVPSREHQPGKRSLEARGVERQTGTEPAYPAPHNISQSGRLAGRHVGRVQRDPLELDVCEPDASKPQAVE